MLAKVGIFSKSARVRRTEMLYKNKERETVKSKRDVLSTMFLTEGPSGRMLGCYDWKSNYWPVWSIKVSDKLS